MATTEIIIGPPGTGKTTRLLDIMENEIKNGVEPNKISFCSFTKKAADEAADRACERFNFKKSDLIYFRTIHSLAFQSLGLKKDQVMQPKDYKFIGKHLGLDFSNGFDFVQESGMGRKNGDQYAFIDSFSRARHMTAKTVWDMVNHDSLNWFEFKRYASTVIDYKKQKNLYDFADMLQFGEAKIDVDVLIIDEAQDLSTAQWYFIERSFPNVKRIYIGGDDDQAIFEWGGADVDKFINLQGNRTVLDKSYRIPNAVHTVATDISGKIKHRSEKTYHSKDEKGSVEYWMNVDDIDMSSGTWLLLARNSYLLGEYMVTVKSKGHTFTSKGNNSIYAADVKAITLWEKYRKGLTLSEKEVELLNDYTNWDKSLIWHEAFTKMSFESRQYYVSLLRRGESLTKPPRITISTIHGSKGGEADHVVLLSDMAYNTWESSNMNSDSEHRVWYVGATRAKESLNIIMPRGRYNYAI